MKTVIFILVVMSSMVRASVTEVTEILSDKYIQGHYLLYDCEDQHWVCTEDVRYEMCQQSLKEALDLKKSYLPCLPVAGEFKSNKECAKEQQYYVTKIKVDLECRHPAVRRHLIEFQ